MNSYHIIGLMSGTSLDGVDLAYCRFEQNSLGKWHVKILNTSGIEYPNNLLERLKNAPTLSSVDLLKLDKDLGYFYGNQIRTFSAHHSLQKSDIDAIASHGHTVFHQPENRFTLQIGCGAELAVHSGIPVINDFRSKDITLGGQGAPLVPIGDHLLFEHLADSFLNIGGFCNVSFPKKAPVIAFDICPGNLPMNMLMESCFGKAYDHRGNKARNGSVNPALLDTLNALDFYSSSGPKSLGTEWLNAHFIPSLRTTSLSAEDILSTLVEHITFQISKTLHSNKAERVLITGGGAKNDFLIERLKKQFNGKVILPEEELIDFKEAIVFGFLGALYLANQNNILKSVTGARLSSRSGILHTP